MTVADVMNRKVVSISADDTLRVVDEIMELGHVRHIPVVRRGELVGVVSQRDLLRASLSSAMGIAREDADEFLESLSIGEVMSSPAISIEADRPLQEAARLMADHKIGCLPVVEGKKLVAIVTETDVLRVFADLELP